MRVLRGFLAGAVVFGALSVGGVSAASERCEEDQPCWDCETMGNQVCGPIDYVPDVPETVPASSVSVVAPAFTG